MHTLTRLAIFGLLAAWPLSAYGQASGSDDRALRELAELKAKFEIQVAEFAETRAAIEALEASLRAPAGAIEAPGVPVADAAGAPASTQVVEVRSVRAANVLAVPLDQPGQDPDVRAAFQLTGSTSGKRAELLLADTVSRTRSTAGNRTMGSFETLSLSASAPLSDDGPTNIGTLDGLDDGFELKLRWTSYLTELLRPGPEQVRAVQQVAKANCLRKEASAPNREEICSADPTTAFLQRYLSQEAFDAYQAAFFGRNSFFGNTSFAWGFEASVGYKDFSFLDPTSAAEDETSRVPLGAELFGVWYPGGGRTAITGSIGYQRSYKAATSAALCGAATLPITQCPVGAVGGPGGKDNFLLSLGERSYIPLEDFIIPGFAIAPTVTYDIEGDHFGFDLPIYLVPNDDGNLVGGIRLGYETEEDDFGIGIFVGSTFSLGQ